jgi:hypothetical protein
MNKESSAPHAPIYRPIYYNRTQPGTLSNVGVSNNWMFISNIGPIYLKNKYLSNTSVWYN